MHNYKAVKEKEQLGKLLASCITVVLWLTSCNMSVKTASAVTWLQRCAVLQVFVTFTGFGCLAILAGIMTLLLPETCGAEMPETIEVSHAARQWV